MFFAPKIIRKCQNLPFIDGDENWKFWLKSDILMKKDKFVGFFLYKSNFHNHMILWVLIHYENENYELQVSGQEVLPVEFLLIA